ncbi:MULTISPECIES: hypothetical protein [unclassified Novosphingobium]|uniref:hypothetical protein n=1 Tax=unclassified Novosphingobium TaxID=2644732 RepID=UPI0025CC28CF|nr:MULTISPECIES: hypothetical protein [unclassified Novosphingobium]HQV02456.1 hypothetical protein [Novosphingobium sp.]
MTVKVDLKIDDLDRSSIIETIYQASLAVSKSGYKIDSNKMTPSYISNRDRKKIASTVAEIVTQIEGASNIKLDDLPQNQRAKLLTDLYTQLSAYILRGAPENSARGKRLLEELHREN